MVVVLPTEQADVAFRAAQPRVPRLHTLGDLIQVNVDSERDQRLPAVAVNLDGSYGVTEGLMWRAVNDDGTLTYSFVESLKAVEPYHGLRLLGGLVFFSGMLIMAYNVWKTVSDKKPVPIAVLDPA